MIPKCAGDSAKYMRSELVATMGSTTMCGKDHLFDMFQHRRTYLDVSGEQFGDVRLTLGFDTWKEAQEVRDLLLAMGL
jgi:hypothetical protein